MSVRHVGLLAYSYGGGVGRVLTNVATGFRDRGIKVTLLGSKIDEVYRRELHASGCDFIDLNGIQLRRMLPYIVKFLREARPDAVVSSGYGVNVMTVVGRMLVGYKGPLLLREDINLTAQWEYNYGALRRKLLAQAVKWAYRKADVCIGVSRDVAVDLSRLTGLSNNRVRTIYNPVVSRKLLEQSREEILDHPWFSEDLPIVLGVGRLVQQKDFGMLIRAFRHVRAIRKARLVIIGEGPERAQLEHLIHKYDLNNDVCLLGYRSNPLPYMAKASVFALSSRWEGFGLVLVEAMAVGTPVISTDCPSGPAEILEGGRWGPLVPVGDDKAMATGILDILDSRTGIREIVERAKDFNTDKVTGEYLRILQSFLG